MATNKEYRLHSYPRTRVDNGSKFEPEANIFNFQFSDGSSIVGQIGDTNILRGIDRSITDRVVPGFRK